MEKSIKSIASNYGLYLGALLAAVTIIGYAVNLEILTKWWLGLLLLLTILVFGIISISSSKKAQGGFIEFKEAFTSFFITVGLGLLISSIVSVVLFNFIDPDAAVALQEQIMETTVAMMRNFGAPEDAVAEAVAKMEAQEGQFSIGSTIQSMLIQLVIYSVLGLIISLVMKKTNPEA